MWFLTRDTPPTACREQHLETLLVTTMEDEGATGVNGVEAKNVLNILQCTGQPPRQISSEPRCQRGCHWGMLDCSSRGRGGREWNIEAVMLCLWEWKLWPPFWKATRQRLVKLSAHISRDAFHSLVSQGNGHKVCKVWAMSSWLWPLNPIFVVSVSGIFTGI